MDYKQAAQTITESVTMNDVFEKYGFTPNRSGFIICPFHAEKTPSLSSYRNGLKWKCFGCGEGGNVIDFVEKLCNLPFMGAVAKLNCDFGLGLPLGHKTLYRERERTREQSAELRRERRAAEQAEAVSVYEQNMLCRFRRWLLKQPQNKQTDFEIEYIDRLLDGCLYGEKMLNMDIYALLRSLYNKIKAVS